MKKQKKDDSWIRICLLPLIVGFSLVISKISMKLFKIIGWVLLIWGIAIGLLYLLRWYKANKKKVLGFLMKINLIKRRPLE
ncbi:unnamed protein product [marine sediment metagenome]|uniref:Uncharacterized protein n=1 Tax=marine sediment metagenome TaxID=412755 RepID=X1IEG3_9ZZZZ